MNVHAGTREERFAPLFFSGLLIACLATTNVAAQAVTPEELIDCSNRGSDAQKLACYEALTSRVAPEYPLAQEPQPEPQPQPEPEASVAVAAEPEAPDEVVSPVEKALPPIAPREAPRVKPEPVTALVLRAGPNSRFDKRLVFEFENGEVWRQMEYSRFQYPRSGSFEVVISQGLMGDFRLRVGGEGRMTRIVRIR